MQQLFYLKEIKTMCQIVNPLTHVH